MTYTILDEEFEFPLITASYLEGDLISTPPYFSSELILPNIIPCLDSNEAKSWLYEFPEVIDDDGD